MAAQRQVFLHLGQLGRHDHRHRVFLAVNGALLQRTDHFGPRHGRGGRTQGFEGGDVHGVFGHADLQALQVGRGLDRVFVVGQVAKALFAPGQRDQAAGLELAQQVLAKRTVQHSAGVGGVAEQEGNVHHTHVGHEVAQCAGGNDHGLDGAELQAFDQLTFAAQCAGGELLELKRAVGAFFDRLGPGLRSGTVMGIHSQGVTELDVFGLLGKSSGGGQAGSNSGQHEAAGDKTHGDGSPMKPRQGRLQQKRAAIVGGCIQSCRHAYCSTRPPHLHADRFRPEAAMTSARAPSKTPSGPPGCAGCAG